MVPFTDRTHCCHAAARRSRGTSWSVASAARGVAWHPPPGRRWFRRGAAEAVGMLRWRGKTMGKPWENGKNLDFMGKTMGKAMENAEVSSTMVPSWEICSVGILSPNDLHGGFHSHGGHPNRWMVYDGSSYQHIWFRGTHIWETSTCLVAFHIYVGYPYLGNLHMSGGFSYLCWFTEGRLYRQ